MGGKRFHCKHLALDKSKGLSLLGLLTGNKYQEIKLHAFTYWPCKNRSNYLWSYLAFYGRNYSSKSLPCKSVNSVSKLTVLGKKLSKFSVLVKSLFHPITKQKTPFLYNWQSWSLQIYLKYREVTTMFSTFSLMHSRKKSRISSSERTSALTRGAEIIWTLEESVEESVHKGKQTRQWRWKQKRIVKKLMLENLFNRYPCLSINAYASNFPSPW